MRKQFSFDGQIDAGYMKHEVHIYRNGEFFQKMSWSTFQGVYPHLCHSNGLRESKLGGINNWEIGIHSEPLIVKDKDGVDGVEAFFNIDSKGIVLPTKHPNILKSLLKTKGSINLHVAMYSEDRAKGRFPLTEFRALCIKWKAPEWFYFAVEKSKNRIYQNDSEIPEWFKEESKNQLNRYALGLKH